MLKQQLAEHLFSQRPLSLSSLFGKDKVVPEVEMSQSVSGEMVCLNYTEMCSNGTLNMLIKVLCAGRDYAPEPLNNK